MTDVALSCRCGKIKGTFQGASSKSGTRVVCYCGDCQAYGRFLGRDDILDAWGGTSIFQTAPAFVTLETADTLAALRLSEKGLYRWYCAECRSLIGNSLTPSIPFVGLWTGLMQNVELEAVLGPIHGHILQKNAKNGRPPHPENNLRVIARGARKLLRWKLRGFGMPHPFWTARTTPRVTPRVLSRSERAAL